MILKEERCRKNPVHLVPIAALLILLCALTGILTQQRNYANAAREYDCLRQYISPVGLADTEGRGATRGGTAGVPADGGLGAVGRGQNHDTYPPAGSSKVPPALRNLPDAAAPELEIDVEALSRINPEYAGVLLIPSLNLCYPVVAGNDNEKYLSTTFEGTKNPSGSIFLDSTASRDLSDLHTFVFGHNMADGSMFGSLKRLGEQPGLTAADPYLYYYVGDRILRYRIFAYGPVDAGDDAAYAYVENEAEYRNLVRHLAGMAWYYDQDGESGAALRSTRPILTLSTCWGTAHRRNFTVHGVLTGAGTLQPGDSGL